MSKELFLIIEELADALKKPKHRWPAGVLGRAKAALESHQWQPISTAPKDGTEISVWCGEIVTVSWIRGWMNYEVGYVDATHWKPIQPPKDE